MIPYDLDPSLHSTEPQDTLLGDGFSPPHHEELDADGKPLLPQPEAHEDLGLGEKSLF
jgi:hypothetical protein